MAAVNFVELIFKFCVHILAKGLQEELENSDYFPMLQEKAKFNRLLLDFTSAADDSQAQIAPKEYWQRRVR